MEEELLERLRTSDPSLTKLQLVFEPSHYFDTDNENGLDVFLDLLRGCTSINYVLLERRLARGISVSENIKLLRAIFKIPHLQEVEIWSQRISWSVLISSAMSAKELRKLGLGMITLKDITPTNTSHPTLESFYLSDFRLLPSDEDDDVTIPPCLDPVLTVLGSCPNLTRVEIYSFPEERPALTTFWPLLAAPRLAQVTLRRLHLPALAVVATDEDRVVIRSPLRILDLSENPLGDEGVSNILRQICEVGSLWRNTLRELNVKGVQCSTDVAPILQETLSQTSVESPLALEKLNLASNKLRDDGAIALARLLELPNFGLQTLELARCNITNTGATALAQSLRRNRHLKVLGLASNDIDDASYVSFGQALARDNNTLQSINLQVDRKLIQETGCMALQEMCRENTTLQDVSTLLNTVVAAAHGKYGNRIRMYLRLNKAGRSTVANNTATLEEWVQLLSVVNDDLFAVHYLLRTHPNYVALAAVRIQNTKEGQEVESPFAGLVWSTIN
eukprot:scaffold1536_cov166-Amphora_coffeaeformis.AAC.6